MDASAKVAEPRAEKLSRRDFTRADPDAEGIIEAPVMSCYLSRSAAVLDGCWGSLALPRSDDSGSVPVR